MLEIQWLWISVDDCGLNPLRLLDACLQASSKGLRCWSERRVRNLQLHFDSHVLFVPEAVVRKPSLEHTFILGIPYR